MDWGQQVAAGQQDPGPIFSLQPTGHCLTFTPLDGPPLYFHPEALQRYLGQLAAAVDQSSHDLRATYEEQQRRLQWQHAAIRDLQAMVGALVAMTPVRQDVLLPCPSPATGDPRPPPPTAHPPAYPLASPAFTFGPPISILADFLEPLLTRRLVADPGPPGAPPPHSGRCPLEMRPLNVALQHLAGEGEPLEEEEANWQEPSFYKPLHFTDDNSESFARVIRSQQAPS
eukprot:GGOE01014609.1.p1 GENE.GGOE01014609.1~~GGOE01014609.1.p1  ORF type:complete len:228 (-),score=42.71 GGOE01014609.1:50-733(-)